MQVSVLGCGWLGQFVAYQFKNNGYTVKGSTTTPAKLSILQDDGIAPYLVNLENPAPEALTGFLHGSEVFIISIPPKIRDSAVSYPDKIRSLLPFIERSGITKVLFVSSTSVYADAFPFPVITEETPPNPQTESGRQILEAEQVLQNNNAFKTTVIRPAGLAGGQRHPVYHLAGREGIENPEAPVNLIDGATVADVIFNVVRQNAWGNLFNIAYNEHPAREAYYTTKALEMGLEAPRFNHNLQSTGKIISPAKAVQSLGVSYIGKL